MSKFKKGLNGHKMMKHPNRAWRDWKKKRETLLPSFKDLNERASIVSKPFHLRNSTI